MGIFNTCKTFPTLVAVKVQPWDTLQEMMVTVDCKELADLTVKVLHFHLCLLEITKGLFYHLYCICTNFCHGMIRNELVIKYLFQASCIINILLEQCEVESWNEDLF